MAEIILDLSGVGGLVDGHAGDEDQVTPSPQLRVNAAENQTVSGFYNPYLRKGYMAPVTTTTVEVTNNSTPNSQFNSVEYSFGDNEVYWADATNKIYKADSLIDNSLELVDTLSDDGTFPGRKWDNIYDMQMYYLNGDPQLFIVGQGADLRDRTDVQLATDTSEDFVSVGIAVAPHTIGTVPTVKTVANSTVNSATPQSISINVTSGTNQLLLLVGMIPDGVFSSSNAEWNGSEAMTLVSQFSSNGNASAFVYALYNPTPANSTIEVTQPGEGVTLYAILIENAAQSNAVDVNYSRRASIGSEVVSVDIPSISKDQLSLAAAKIDTNGTSADTSTSYNFIEEILDEQDSDFTLTDPGHDFLVRLDTKNYGLQIAKSNLPVTTIGNTDASWFTSRATDAFQEEVVGDYAFMREADNGFAYVFNGNRVHKIDGGITGGSNGLVTKNVLLFPENFRIIDALDYRSRMFMALHQYPVTGLTTSLNNYRGRCGIFIWDRLSTVFGQADYIELPGVREIKKVYASPDGVVKLITIGSHGLTEVRRFGYNDSGGVVFPVFNNLGLGGYPQVPDGLTIAGDKAIWLANNGNLYCEKLEAITKLYQADTPGTTSTTLAENISSGAIFFGGESETADDGYRANKQGITMSYDDGSVVTEKIYPFDLKTGSNGAQTPNAGNVYSAVKYIPVTSIVRSIRILNAPTTLADSTAVATVKIYFNQSTNPTMPDGMTKTITAKEASRGYVDFKINKQYVHSVQIEVEWATAIPIGENTYLPSVAIISTEDTEVRSPDSE